jgi:hypothetical protein
MNQIEFKHKFYRFTIIFSVQIRNQLCWRDVFVKYIVSIKFIHKTLGTIKKHADVKIGVMAGISYSFAVEGIF